MDSYVIEGARAVLPGGTEAVALRVEDGRIAALDGPRDGAPVVDARGLVLAPALVDVHGDAFERQLMPRPGVFFPLDVAVMETDRQLAGNGIATAYHALTLGWEPGLRSVARGTELVRLWQALCRFPPVSSGSVLFAPRTLTRILESISSYGRTSGSWIFWNPTRRRSTR